MEIIAGQHHRCWVGISRMSISLSLLSGNFVFNKHLDDLLLRRTRLGNVLPCGARELLPKIKALCSPYLSWNEQKWQEEINRYLAIWQNAYSLPNHKVEEK